MVEKLSGLSPELLIHPGETLQELLEDREIDGKWLAGKTGFSEHHIAQVLKGNISITPPFAKALETVFGVEAAFWMNLQANYDEELLGYKRRQG